MHWMNVMPWSSLHQCQNNGKNSNTKFSWLLSPQPFAKVNCTVPLPQMGKLSHGAPKGLSESLLAAKPRSFSAVPSL